MVCPNVWFELAYNLQVDSALAGSYNPRFHLLHVTIL